MKVWARYLLLDLLITFLCIFVGAICLFTLFDYAIHMHPLTADLSMHYLCLACKYAQTLVPMSFLIAMIKVLCSLNIHHELTALLAGGLSLKKLSLPFLATSACLTFALLINNQYWLPKALREIDAFQTVHQSQMPQKNLTTLHLEDGSKLYYQRIFPKQHTLFDVFWLPNQQEVYRMKSLTLTEHGVAGFSVDHLQRRGRQLQLLESYEHLIIQKLLLSSLIALDLFTPPQARSITELIASDSHPKVQTQLALKILLPTVCILICIALFPICTKYSRLPNTFFLYTICLFVFVIFHAIMGAATILGETHTANPILVIVLPIGLPMLYFGRRYLWI